MTIKAGKRKLLPPPDPSEFLPVQDLSFFAGADVASSAGTEQDEERTLKRSRIIRSMDVMSDSGSSTQQRSLLDLPDDYLQRIYGRLPHLPCCHRFVCRRFNLVLPGAEKVLIRVNSHRGHLVTPHALRRYTSNVELGARRCRGVVDPLAEAVLAGWNALSSIDLSFNEAGNASIAQLARALQGNARLRVLLLGYNGITSTGGSAEGQDAVTTLAKSMATWTALEELDLEGNVLSFGAGEELMRAVRHCSRLHTLGLRSCMIMDSGARALASSLSRVPALTKINLENNALSADAVAALLPACPTLKHLHLDGNMPFGRAASRQGAFEGLATLSNLRVLSLFNCQLCPDDIAPLGQALANFNELRSLDLSRNLHATRDNIALDTLQLLVQPLFKMPHLRMVDLAGNEFGAAARTMVAFYLSDRVRWSWSRGISL